MAIPVDYIERVYAGVLGKLIGVYLGRPFEGWTHDRIMAELGPITWYVHERRGVPLIVTDDDISGTLTFVRALEDYGFDPAISAAQIGQTWLNYLIENRTILWWGGMGNSTENTAYLRLKHGLSAPESGSIARNGALIAEQIGAQIFIDAWAMVAPADPEKAADLARRAASVSHDGEAIYGAQVLAAMESQAFVEADVDRLLDTGLSVIPRTSRIFRMIGDIREWHSADQDWRKTFRRIDERYGYAKFGGNCHIMPNHGIIILGLLAGGGEFQKTLMIVNTCGLDTDCNSGNAGCLMGIMRGLAGIDAGPDWRGPVADRIFIPTADGGRCITDAVREAYSIANAGLAMSGAPALRPKEGARFHFELPGSLQGFHVEDSVECRGTAILENVPGHSRTGARSLAIAFRQLAPGRRARVATATFIPPEALTMPGYTLMASPTLYSGQEVRAGVSADAGNQGRVRCCLYVAIYGAEDKLELLRSPELALDPGRQQAITWVIPDTGCAPIAEAGVELNGDSGVRGTVFLDFLTWGGTPTLLLKRPAGGGKMWERAWVNGVDRLGSWKEPFRIIQNEGRGLLMQGTREWTDYRVSAEITLCLAASAGIAARVQGMRRFYALVLQREGKARLVKSLDGDAVLYEMAFPWEQGSTHRFELEVRGSRLSASIDGRKLGPIDDKGRLLDGGGIAFLCEEGWITSEAMRVEAL